MERGDLEIGTLGPWNPGSLESQWENPWGPRNDVMMGSVSLGL